MRPGLFNLPAERIKRFDSGPVVIAAAGNTFYHGMNRVPGTTEIRLVCVTPNNGYVAGEEIPLDRIYRVTGGVKDGYPASPVRITDQKVVVLVPSSNVEIVDTAGAPGSVTIANFRLRVVCLDAFPLG